MKNFQRISKEKYKELLGEVSFKTFFHETKWQDFLESEFKWLKFEYYLYKPARRSFGGGGDELLLSFGRIGDKLISLPFCEYGGPLPLKEKVDLDEFINDVLKEFKNIKVKVHPQISLMWEVEPPTGGSTSSILTHWIENLDKLGPEDLFKSFRKTLRHSIRNAQKHNLEIKKCSNLKALKQFYNLYVDNLRRKKTVPYPFPVIKFLYNSPDTELLLAWYKDKIIAGDLFLHYNGFVHYFLSALDYKHRELGASYFILWKKIKSLCGKDVVFDLGAAPKGSALETFKRGWRGKEYPILQIGTKRTPAYAKASAGREESLRYSRVRDLWGLLPIFIIKILSRYFVKYRL